MVTGGASGIGRACARRLAAAGARVVVRRPGRRGGEGGGGRGRRRRRSALDLADLDAVDRLDWTGREPDVLVNNAGLQHVAPLQDFPPERVLADPAGDAGGAVPAGPARLLPHMYAQGWGRVVNISSVHGLRASPYKAAYVAAKHGLEGLSKVIALEGADARRHLQLRQPGVRADRRWWSGRSPPRRQAHGMPEDEVVERVMLAPAALKRLIEPDEVAEAGRLPVLARRRRSSPARRS